VFEIPLLSGTSTRRRKYATRFPLLAALAIALKPLPEAEISVLALAYYAITFILDGGEGAAKNDLGPSAASPSFAAKG